MSKNSFDLRTIFAHVRLGDSYLCELVNLPVVPEVFESLVRNSVMLYTPNGKGGVLPLKASFRVRDDGSHEFETDHYESRFSISVNPKEPQGLLFWKAAIPYGFTLNVAPESILALCWDDSVTAQMERPIINHPDARLPEMLGAMKGFQDFTGMDFVLQPHRSEKQR